MPVGTALRAEWAAAHEAWRAANPDRAALLDRLVDGTLPPTPLSVTAKPAGTIPEGLESFFRRESTPATLAIE